MICDQLGVLTVSNLDNESISGLQQVYAYLYCLLAFDDADNIHSCLQNRYGEMDLLGRTKAVESILLGGTKVYVHLDILLNVRYGARTCLSEFTAILD